MADHKEDKSRHSQGSLGCLHVVLGAVHTFLPGLSALGPRTSEELHCPDHRNGPDGWMSGAGQAKEVLVSTCVCCVCVMH